jgi:hypothetical protein
MESAAVQALRRLTATTSSSTVHTVYFKAINMYSCQYKFSHIYLLSLVFGKCVIRSPKRLLYYLNLSFYGFPAIVRSFFFILNIFIALRYTYTTPVVTGSKNQGLGEDDRTPPVGYGHLGIQMPVLLMNMQVTNSY